MQFRRWQLLHSLTWPWLACAFNTSDKNYVRVPCTYRGRVKSSRRQASRAGHRLDAERLLEAGEVEEWKRQQCCSSKLPQPPTFSVDEEAPARNSLRSIRQTCCSHSHTSPSALSRIETPLHHLHIYTSYLLGHHRSRIETPRSTTAAVPVRDQTQQTEKNRRHHIYRTEHHRRGCTDRRPNQCLLHRGAPVLIHLSHKSGRRASRRTSVPHLPRRNTGEATSAGDREAPMLEVWLPTVLPLSPLTT